MLTLAKSQINKIIFVGAVGVLKAEIELGDLVTPLDSYSYEGESLYLGEKSINNYWVRQMGFVEYRNEKMYVKAIEK